MKLSGLRILINAIKIEILNDTDGILTTHIVIGRAVDLARTERFPALHVISCGMVDPVREALSEALDEVHDMQANECRG